MLIHFIYYNYFSVEVCPALHIPSYGSLNTTLSLFDTRVLATCFDGFHFPGTDGTILIQCLLGQLWSVTVQDCIREYTKIT